MGSGQRCPVVRDGLLAWVSAAHPGSERLVLDDPADQRDLFAIVSQACESAGSEHGELQLASVPEHKDLSGLCDGCGILLSARAAHGYRAVWDHL